jgi:two-component system phosphate regulon response regulator PhoB
MVSLTQTQFRLLECLLSAPGQVFSRARLCTAAIADGAIVLERTIDVHVAAIRRKLGVSDLIETVRGQGYRIRAEMLNCVPDEK